MLYFDEATHTYRIDDTVLKSVTQVVAEQFRPFNASVVSTNLAKTKSIDPDSKYFGMTKQDIVTMWAETGRQARESGCLLHKQIEDYYTRGTTPETPTVEWKQFLQFVADHPDWKIYACEFRVHKEKVAGTIDAIFHTPNGFALVDWKRCRALDYSGHGNGRDLMCCFSDCNYNKYSLQLSLYKQLFPYETKDMFIIQFHPELESYQKVRAQDYHLEAKLLIHR